MASDLFEYNCAFLADGYTNDDGSIDYERFKLALMNANSELQNQKHGSLTLHTQQCQSAKTVLN